MTNGKKVNGMEAEAPRTRDVITQMTDAMLEKTLDHLSRFSPEDFPCLLDKLPAITNSTGLTIYVTPYREDDLKEIGVNYIESLALASLESILTFEKAVDDPDYSKEDLAALALSVSHNNEFLHTSGKVSRSYANENFSILATKFAEDYQAKNSSHIDRGKQDKLNKVKAVTARWEKRSGGESRDEAYLKAVAYIKDLVNNNKMREGHYHHDLVEIALKIEWIKSYNLSQTELRKKVAKMLRDIDRYDLIWGENKPR